MTAPATPGRRRLLRGALGACAASAAGSLPLAGCGGAPRTDYHLLRDAAPASPPAPARVDEVLLIAPGTPASLYDTERMVFSADGSSRSYFQFGFWSERPQRRLLLLAEDRLAHARAFREVALSTSGVRGGLLLTLRLESLYADDAADPAQARLAFGAELVDWTERRLVARRSFERAAPMPRRDAAGFADAASVAMGELLGELTGWAVASASAARRA